MALNEASTDFGRLFTHSKHARRMGLHIALTYPGAEEFREMREAFHMRKLL
jgi:hypothetical protein